jgi:hypothetical protein
MTAHFDQARVELDKHLFLRLVNAAGTTIVCLEGSLWITRDGCPKDVELSPGKTYRVEDAARVIVTGFGPSQAWVTQPALHRRPAARRAPIAALRQRASQLAQHLARIVLDRRTV